MRYKSTTKALPEIARELGVNAVVTGSVQRASGRVRIMAQLIHGTSDRHLWADEYERDLSDVLRLESDIAHTIAGEIRIQITAQDRTRLRTAGAVKPDAHEAYLLWSLSCLEAQ
jgi:adenylate cyclase